MTQPSRRLMPLLVAGTLALVGLGTGVHEEPTIAAPPVAVSTGLEPTVPPSPSPAPSPSPSPTPSPTPSPAPSPHATVDDAGLAWLIAAGGASTGTGGRTVRYVVEVEEGLDVDVAGFADAVDAILGDPRSWTANDDLRLERVAGGTVDFRITLASPPTVDRLCRPLDTGGYLSCWNGGRALLNVDRWNQGATTYGDDVAGYRIYLVNHEVGHALGHDHRRCSRAGEPAHVMVQQTKSLGGCTPNPWPHPDNDPPGTSEPPTSPTPTPGTSPTSALP